MTQWTNDVLNAIGEAVEIELAPRAMAACAAR